MELRGTGSIKRKLLAFLGPMVLCSAVFLPSSHASVQTEAPARFNAGFTVIDLPYRASGNGTTTLTVAVWYPTTAAPATYTYAKPVSGMVAPDAPILRPKRPYPLLVFSHGYGGSGLSAAFLFEKLAARGWIVAAPDHRDKHSAVRIRTGRNKDLDRIAFLRNAENISNSDAAHRDQYLYRVDELRAVLDGMVKSAQFGTLIDTDRIAVGGHSLGGFTALGVCGTIEGKQDSRVKAVLLFSSGAGGYLYREDELARVKVPSFYIYGEREKDQKRNKNTMAELADKIWRNLPPPKYLLELKGGNHFSFNNNFSARVGSSFLGGHEKQFDVIRSYSIAFLEKYVAGREDMSGVLDRQDQLLTRYIRKVK